MSSRPKGNAADVYGFYVEKEYVGRHVKGSKVKVVWKFACLPELKTNEVELKHSLVFGKREIKLNGTLVYQRQKLFNGDFVHEFAVANHILRVSIREDFEGYVYDLRVDGVAFHKLTRVSAEKLQEMRNNLGKSKGNPSDNETGKVTEMPFNEFVGSGENGKQSKKGSGAKLSKAASSDDSESSKEVEEDLWNVYESNQQKQQAAQTQSVAGWGGSNSAPFVPGTGVSAPQPPPTYGVNQSYGAPPQGAPDVSRLSQGFEGLHFNSSPSYTCTLYPQTSNTTQSSAQNPSQGAQGLSSTEGSSTQGWYGQSQPVSPSYENQNSPASPSPGLSGAPQATTSWNSQPATYNTSTAPSSVAPSQGPKLTPESLKNLYAQGQSQGGAPHGAQQQYQPQQYQLPPQQYQSQQPFVTSPLQNAGLYSAQATSPSQAPIGGSSWTPQQQVTHNQQPPQYQQQQTQPPQYQQNYQQVTQPVQQQQQQQQQAYPAQQQQQQQAYSTQQQ